MSKTYMVYKVKFQGNNIAQFATANLAVHFIKSLPANDFVINYNNFKTVWDTAKEGTPNAEVIEEKVEKIWEERDAKFDAKMASFQSARKVGA
jgi:hypothetical protein